QHDGDDRRPRADGGRISRAVEALGIQADAHHRDAIGEMRDRGAAGMSAGVPSPKSLAYDRSALGDGMRRSKLAGALLWVASGAIEHYVSPSDKNFVVQGWWTVPTGGCQSIGNFPRG